MTPEGKVKEKIKKILKTRGAWYFLPVSNGLGVHGIPDIIACYKCTFLGIEVKATAKNKPTARQLLQLRGIEDAGGVPLVIHGGNIEELEATLDALDMPIC